MAPSTSFISKRVNDTTFLLIEDDAYGEQPYIYVKIYSEYLLITDTGCNASRICHREVKSLRDYLETYPVPAANGRILNPEGKKGYIIICSHCHYDHILGIPQFLSSNPHIIASGFDSSFLLEDLPSHSQCKWRDAPTPKYPISHWARHLETYSFKDTRLRIQFLHIPGHVPDSLAWYDIDEHHLYVGDTFYERKRTIPIPELPDDAGTVPGMPATQAAIIFPHEGGNWIQYMSSLDLLLSFIQYENAKLRRQHGFSLAEVPRVKVGCGHLTYNADAETMVLEVRALFERIIAGKVPVQGSGERREIIYDFWIEGDDARYSVMGPRHLAEEAREHFKGASWMN
ncbi:hypothetical protein B7463_g11578, partial [Scytalidium lignicola]